MKNFLAPLILIISFDASSAFDRWEEAYFKPLMAGDILPSFDKNELYFASSEPAQIQQSRVIKGLLDGKTYKIRLSEIDAPERSQPFGRQSKVYLRNLLEKGVFDAHINQQDQYGRYLAKIYSNGIDINRAMVAGGMAWVYDLYVIDTTLYKDQIEAQKKKKGLWSKRQPAPPWEWRRARRR